MYFFTWDPRFHLREWYQKLRHVDEGTSKILTSMYFLHPQCHLRKWFQNKAMCTKPRAKSRLRCICYTRPAVPSARMVSKTKTCGQSDEQNIGFDIFLQETGGVICDGIKNWDMWTKRQSKPWLRCIFTGDPQCHLREWYQKLRHVDEATSKILTSMYFFPTSLCGVLIFTDDILLPPAVAQCYKLSLTKLNLTKFSFRKLSLTRLSHMPNLRKLCLGDPFS
jgi:hypothetical protein